MEIVRLTVAVFFVLVSVSSSNAPSGGGGAGGGDAHAMPCIQKLMPCQPYLHSVTPPPPPSCCLPMKEIVANDATCLCSVFNNVDMLKSLNLTKDNALDLPKACGANPDVSQCKASTGTTTSTSPATPKSPPVSSTGSSSTGASSSSTPTAISSAPAINFAGHSFALAIVALTTIFF